MSNKESLVAASLFGDSSSGADFFATLQADPPPETSSSNNTQPHSIAEPSRQFSQGPATLPTNAADLFGASDAGTSVDSLWGEAVDGSAGQHQEWPAQEQQHQQWPTATTGYSDGQDPSSQQTENYDYSGQDYAQNSVNGNAYGGHDGYANYDANGLHQNYATSYAPQNATTDYYSTYAGYETTPQSTTSAQYPSYPTPVSSDPYKPASTTYGQQPPYDPYAPTTTSAYTPSNNQPTAPTSSTQSASSTHSATTSSRGLYPGVTFATQSSYDPYKPTGSTKAPPPAKSPVQAPPVTPYTPTYPSYPAYSTPEPAPKPKPTQTAAEVYRATSYNAYDPPVLDRPRKSKAGHGSLLSPPPSATVPNYPAGPLPTGGRRTPAAAPPPPPRAQSPYYQAPPAPAPPAQPASVRSPPYLPHQIHPSHRAHSPSVPYGAPLSNAQPPAQPYSAQAPQQIYHTTGGSQPGWDTTAGLQTNGTSNLEEDWYADEFPKDEPQSQPQPQRAEISLDPEDVQTPHYDPYREDVVSEPGRRSLDAFESNRVDSFAASGFVPAASTVEQSSSYDPYAPPRRASLASNSSHGSAAKPPQSSQPIGAATSPTLSSKSPRSVVGSVPTSPQDQYAVNGASPPARYQSPPTKVPPPPPRTGTPGSVRTRIASPELSLRGRASPRPEAIIALEKTRAASPAAHLEAARSRITSPPTGGAKPQPPPMKVSPTNGTSNYDPYKPRAGTLPSSEPSKPAFTPLDGMIPRTASPYTAEPTDGGQTSSYGPYSPQVNGHARRYTSESASSAQHNPYGVSSVPAESAYTPRASIESTYSNSYVPSTAQTGGDDLLARTTSRAPIISFGFGGKVVSCFSKQIDGSAGFDVSLISRRPPPVSVRPLKSIMMEEAPKFPGPLFSDPGTPTVNITRTAAATVKAKKALVLKYLEERAAEVEAEIGQLAPEDRSQPAGKLSLILILKVMVENDGKVSGSPEIESAVRTALLPRLKDALDTSTFGFTSPAGNGLLVPGHPALSHPSANEDQTVATYTIRSSMLDTIQEHLLRGEKRMAYRHALDEKLWAHAMLIASSLDQDAWKETVGEFVRTELGVDPTRASAEPANGREALRVAYSLFAGHGASAVKELLPPKPLARTMGSNHSLIIPPSPLPPSTPSVVGTASFTVPPGPAPIESLSKWQEAAATIANVSSGDTAALTALGDLLMANKWANAAHACYLLSLQTSPLGGAGSPASKVILVGSENPLLKPNFHVEDDPFIFSEVLEFAFSLVPTVKGQDAFSGIPHLQAYRLVQAFRLAEHGYVSLASRYCDAIATTVRVGKPSPFYTRTFLEQLKDLSDRLSGTPQLDKTGSWIARKMTKPSLATLGNWIESGVTKFIAGEGDETQANADSAKKQPGGAAAGPFAQFTVISSANTSPNASSANLSTMLSIPSSGLAPPSTAPPRRSGSAMAVRGPYGMYGGSAPPDRAASAMDMRPDPLSPMTGAGFQVLSANAATTFYEADSAYRGAADNATASSMSASQSTDTERPTYGSWYDSGSQGDDGSKSTSAATFYSVPAEGDAGGFISPMDSLSGGPASRAPSHLSTPRSMSVATVEEEDMEDLGFGNSSSKKKQTPKTDDGQEEEKKESKSAEKPAAPPPTSASKPASPTEAKASGSSWLPWKWGKKEEPLTPGPVKASLGEESSFYYDKELKRWVNKKGGGDTSAAPAAPPPPPSRAPSRAQTASPGQMAPMPSALSRGATPPPRPQSSTSASNSTLKPLTSMVPPRRSHLAESYVPSPDSTSTPPTPTAEAGPTRSRIIDPDLVPPPSRAGSAAAKRKGKSRYIDVFQQEQGGAASS